MSTAFVPADFEIPLTFEGPGFRMEPLGPVHNERDHAAWMSSVDHIRATPGFGDSDWPTPMSLQENLSDLVGHATDFENREGFTFSILDGDDVIGCLYIYPARTAANDAHVRSWVSEHRADMDVTVWRTVSAWLPAEWPFLNPSYEPRPE
ncbi:MAG: N-acetyltransferase [Acidimicrobiia bacterium]